MKHPDIAPFIGKRVRVYHRSGDIVTGYLQMADARLLAELTASGYLESRRVYQVESSDSHPEVLKTSYMISDPATIDRIELVG